MRKKIKKILLIRPSTTLPARTRNHGIAEPLGLLYIASVLLKNGYDVRVCDSASVDLVRRKGDYVTYGGNSEYIKEAIEGFSPDIVGVSGFASCNELDMFEVCKVAKKVDKNIPVVVGGSHPTIFPERMLKKRCIDYVILREGEHRFVALINALNNGKFSLDFDGIAYKESGKIKVNPSIHWIENLDSLPYPARELVDMDKYSQINEKYNFTRPFKKGSVLATRGCIYNCPYCLASKFCGSRIRERSVNNIIGEIRLLKEKYGMEDIFFVEDNIGASKVFIKELFKKLNKIKIRWDITVGFRPEILDRDSIRLVSESGAQLIKISIESGSERSRRKIMRRHYSLDFVKKIIKECHSYKLRVNGSFIFGMIGENLNDLFKTLQFIRQSGLDSFAIAFVVPLPGTDFYNEAVEKGYLSISRNFRDVVMDNIYTLKIPRSSPDFIMQPDKLTNLLKRINKKNLLSYYKKL